MTFGTSLVNPIRHFIALVGARRIVHVSRIRVNTSSAVTAGLKIWWRVSGPVDETSVGCPCTVRALSVRCHGDRRRGNSGRNMPRTWAKKKIFS